MRPEPRSSMRPRAWRSPAGGRGQPSARGLARRLGVVDAPALRAPRLPPSSAPPGVACAGPPASRGGPPGRAPPRLARLARRRVGCPRLGRQRQPPGGPPPRPAAARGPLASGSRAGGGHRPRWRLPARQGPRAPSPPSVPPRPPRGRHTPRGRGPARWGAAWRPRAWWACRRGRARAPSRRGVPMRRWHGSAGSHTPWRSTPGRASRSTEGVGHATGERP